MTSTVMEGQALCNWFSMCFIDLNWCYFTNSSTSKFVNFSCHFGWVFRLPQRSHLKPPHQLHEPNRSVSSLLPTLNSHFSLFLFCFCCKWGVASNHHVFPCKWWDWLLATLLQRYFDWCSGIWPTRNVAANLLMNLADKPLWGCGICRCWNSVSWDNRFPFRTEEEGARWETYKLVTRTAIELLDLPRIVTQFDCFMGAMEASCREILFGRSFRCKNSQLLLPTVDLPWFLAIDETVKAHFAGSSTVTLLQEQTTNNNQQKTKNNKKNNQQPTSNKQQTTEAATTTTTTRRRKRRTRTRARARKSNHQQPPTTKQQDDDQLIPPLAQLDRQRAALWSPLRCWRRVLERRFVHSLLGGVSLPGSWESMEKKTLIYTFVIFWGSNHIHKVHVTYLFSLVQSSECF